jgi:hypothetical protein
MDHRGSFPALPRRVMLTSVVPFWGRGMVAVNEASMRDRGIAPGGINLTLLGTSGAIGSGGDAYVGLDRFGRVNSFDTGHLAKGDYFAKNGDSESVARLATHHAAELTGQAVPQACFYRTGYGASKPITQSHGITQVPYRIEDLSASEPRILIGAYAGAPLVPFAPPIEYKIAFDFKRGHPKYVNVTLSGEPTPFPDFEGYIIGQMIYHAESPGSGAPYNDLGFHSLWVNIPPTGIGVRG